MTPSLRERQRQVAREMIMQAAADLIVERGLENLSLADVAERAGVSKRTLYNHFESRETLLHDIGRWSEQLTLEHGGAVRPEGLDTLPDVIRAVWRTWDRQGTIRQALLRIEAASSGSDLSGPRLERRRAFVEAIEDVRPDLPPDQVAEMAAVFHAVSSAPMFERLVVRDGLDVESAGALIGWTLAVMRDALAAGSDPFDATTQADVIR